MQEWEICFEYANMNGIQTGHEIHLIKELENVKLAPSRIERRKESLNPKRGFHDTNDPDQYLVVIFTTHAETEWEVRLEAAKISYELTKMKLESPYALGQGAMLVRTKS